MDVFRSKHQNFYFQPVELERVSDMIWVHVVLKSPEQEQVSEMKRKQKRKCLPSFFLEFDPGLT
jgi:hypothetical protein